MSIRVVTYLQHERSNITCDQCKQVLANGERVIVLKGIKKNHVYHLSCFCHEPFKRGAAGNV